jgi:hypothetical protein
MRRSIVRALMLVFVLAGTTACGDDEPTTPTDPTDTRPTLTDTFSGTVTVNGARTHRFDTGGSGRIDATLTTLAPDSAARIGLSIGTWNGSACQIVIANDNATQGTLVPGNAGSAGAFCVRLYDVGQLSGPADYTVTVVHF